MAKVKVGDFIKSRIESKDCIGVVELEESQNYWEIKLLIKVLIKILNQLNEIYMEIIQNYHMSRAAKHLLSLMNQHVIQLFQTNKFFRTSNKKVI